MSSPTFRFSQETFQFFRENQENLEFIRPPEEAVDESGLVWTTHGSGTQFRYLDSGNLEVALVTVLDDDVEPENGRIFLKDYFEVDPEGKVPKYHRQIIWNEKGEDREYWEHQVQLFREKHTVRKDLLDRYKSFVGKKIAPRATHFTNSFNRAFWNALEGLPQQDQSFIYSWGTAIEENKIPFVLNFKDPKSQYSVEFRGGRIEITLRAAALNKKDRKHLAYVEDRFALDLKTLEVLNHSRNWFPVPEAVQDKELGQWVQTLNSLPKPDLAAAKSFMKGMMPFFKNYSGPVLDLNQQRADASLFDSVAPPPLSPKPVIQSPLGESRLQALNFVAGIAQERMAMRINRSKGWLGDGKLQDSAEVTATLKVLEGVQAAWKKGEDKSILEILDEMKLDGREGEIRDLLLKDRMVRQVSFFAEETDAGTRGAEYLNLIRRDFMGSENLAGTAQVMANKIRDEAPQGSKLRQEAEILCNYFSGQSGAATSLEMQAPQFMNHVFTPETLAAFYVGGLAGSAAEATAYRGLRSVGWIKGTNGVLNALRLGFGAGVGLAAESAAFAGANQVAGSFRHDPEKVIGWQRFKTEWASMALLLGMTRVAHLGTGGIQQWMSKTERGLPKWLFQKRIAEGSSEALRVPIDPMGRWQSLGPVPQLNFFGSTVAGTLNHGAGILAMKKAMDWAPGLGLAQESEPHRAPTLVDSAVMYLQAALGFNLANFTSGGALQQSIAQLKFTGKTLGELPIPLEKVKAETKKEPVLETDTVVDLTELEGAQTVASPDVGTEFRVPTDSLVDGLSKTLKETSTTEPPSGPDTRLDTTPPAPETEPSQTGERVTPSELIDLIPDSDRSPSPTRREVTLISATEGAEIPKPESRPEPLPDAVEISPVKGKEILQANQPAPGRIRQAWENLWDQLIFGGRLMRLDAEAKGALDGLQRALQELGILRPAAEAWVQYADNKEKTARYLRGEIDARNTDLRQQGEELKEEKAARGKLEKRVEELEETSKKLAEEGREWKQKFEEEEVKGARAVLARDSFSKTIDGLVKEREQADRFIKRLEGELKELKDQLASGDAANLGETLKNLQDAVGSFQEGSQSIQEMLVERTRELDEANSLIMDFKEEVENLKTLNLSLESGKNDLETRLNKIKAKLQSIPEIREEKLDVDDGVDKIIKIVKKVSELYEEATAENAQLYENLRKKDAELQETKEYLGQALLYGKQAVQGEMAKRSEAEKIQGELSEELSRANRRVENLRRDNQTLEEQNRDRKERNDKMRSRLETSEKRTKEVEVELESLRAKITELTQQVLEAQEGESQEIQRLRGEVSRIKSELLAESGKRKAAEKEAGQNLEKVENSEREIDRLNTEIARLEKELAQKDTEVAKEVLDENRRTLASIPVPDPAQGNGPLSLNPEGIDRPLMLGYLGFSPEGRIIKTQLGVAQFKPQEGASFKTPAHTREGRVLVVTLGDQVVWHQSLEGLNGKQKTALADLAKEAGRFQSKDPYSAQAVMGEGLGPLALDLFHLLPDAQMTAQETGSFRANLQLVENNGVLRLYHHGANADWAINAKKYLTHPENGFNKIGPVEIEFKEPRPAGSKPPFEEVLFHFRIGEHPNIEGLVQVFEHFGSRFGEKVFVRLGGRPEGAAGPSQPTRVIEESEHITIVSPPKDGAAEDPKVPPAPKLPEIELLDADEMPTRVLDLAELPPLPKFELKEKSQKRGTTHMLRPVEIRVGETDEKGVPSLNESIKEFGILSGATYEGVDYEGGENQDGFGRFFSPDGSLVLAGIDGVGGNYLGKLVTQSVLETLGREITQGRSVDLAFQWAAQDLTTEIDNYLRRLPEGERISLENHPDFDPNAAVVAAQIRPPETDGGDYIFQPFWAGDAVVMVQRKIGDRWQWIYSSVEDNQAQEILTALKGNPEMYQASFGEQDPELVQRTHPYSHKITNLLSREGVQRGLRTLEDGMILDPLEVVTLKDGTKGLRLRVGDRIILGSDGLTENVGKRQQILDMADSEKPGEALVAPYFREIHHRQQVLSQARHTIDHVLDEIIEEGKKQMGGKDKIELEYQGRKVLVFRTEYSTGSTYSVYTLGENRVPLQEVIRVPIQLNGRKYFVNDAGHVFESLVAPYPVDHIKSDNFFAQILELNPEGLKTKIMPAVKPSPPVRQPRPAPSDFPQGKGTSGDSTRPKRPSQPTVADSPMAQGRMEEGRNTSIMARIVEGEIFPLRSNLTEDSAAVGVIKKDPGDSGWVVKLIDPRFSIKVTSGHQGASGGSQFATILTEKGQVCTLVSDEYRIEVNGVVTEFHGVDENTAMVGNQSQGGEYDNRGKGKQSHEQPLPLTNRKSPSPRPVSNPKEPGSSPFPPPPPPPGAARRDPSRKVPPPPPRKKAGPPPLPTHARAKGVGVPPPKPPRPQGKSDRADQSVFESGTLAPELMMPPPVDFAPAKPPLPTGYDTKTQVLSWGTARRVVIGAGGWRDAKGIEGDHENFRLNIEKNNFIRENFVILFRENVTEQKVKITNTGNEVLWITPTEGAEPVPVQPGISSTLFPGQRVTYGHFNFMLSFD